MVTKNRGLMFEEKREEFGGGGAKQSSVLFGVEAQASLPTSMVVGPSRIKLAAGPSPNCVIGRQLPQLQLLALEPNQYLASQSLPSVVPISTSHRYFGLS